MNGINIANFPSDILYNPGLVYIGSGKFGATSGPPKFTASRTVENIPFDGKYADVKGLDRVMHGNASIAFTMIELGNAPTGNQLPVFEPGVTNATTSAPGAPGTITPVGAITGGTLAAGSYFYKVVAVSLGGDSVASAEATGTVASGTSGSVALTVAAVTGATGYKWYRGTAAGLESLYFSSVGPTFTDIGGAGTLGTPNIATNSTITYTPQSAGALVAVGAYVTDFRILWERGAEGSGKYFAIRFPVALCTKFAVEGQDKKNALIPVEFTARLDLTSGNTTDAPYVLEYRTSTP
jgi:hypothetical protein